MIGITILNLWFGATNVDVALLIISIFPIYLTIMMSRCVDWSIPTQWCTTLITETTIESGCTVDRYAMGYCNLVQYTTEIPSYFRYFDNPKEGGSDAISDYCPYFAAYSNGDCRSSKELIWCYSYFLDTQLSLQITTLEQRLYQSPVVLCLLCSMEMVINHHLGNATDKCALAPPH